MSFFDQFTDSISKFTKDIGSKAQELTDTAKLNSRINEANNTIKNTYTAIGEAFFKAHKDDEDAAENEQFQIIRDAMDTVDECRRQIQKIKGIRICPNCGAELAKTAQYCQSCGEKVPEIVEEVPEEAAAEAEEILNEAEEAAEEIIAEAEDVAEEVQEEAAEAFAEAAEEIEEAAEEEKPENGTDWL